MSRSGPDKRTFVKQLMALSTGLVLSPATRAFAGANQRPAARDVDISPLFTSFAFGPYVTRNRFVMAPMSVGDYHDGAPTAEVSAHYESRAAGGVGLLITGGTIVDHPFGSAETNVGRMNAQTLDAWRRVIDRVHLHGAGIFCQLWHLGPLTRPGIGPRAIVEGGSRVVTEATRSDLESVIDAFTRSARLAQAAGFDGVEIHGAHGYLLDSYLRTFGIHAASNEAVTGDTFVYLLVKAVRAAVGPRFPIGFRFSRWTSTAYSGNYLATPDAMAGVLVPLKQAGVDLFHASRGYGPFWPPEYAGSPLSLAGWCRRISGLPTVTVGHVGLDPQLFFGDRAGSLATLLHQFAAGQFDLVAVGRALLKNPQWVDMLRHKRYAELIAAGPAE